MKATDTIHDENLNDIKAPALRPAENRSFGFMQDHSSLPLELVPTDCSEIFKFEESIFDISAGQPITWVQESSLTNEKKQLDLNSCDSSAKSDERNFKKCSSSGSCSSVEAFRLAASEIQDSEREFENISESERGGFAPLPRRTQSA